MKRKLAILLFLISGIVLNAETYYVKNGGNDALDGLTDATAWATVNKTFSGIGHGDTVLFARGSIWREIIVPVYGAQYDYTYYGAYRTGDKPLFLGSVEKNATGDWTNVSGNIWTTANGSFTVDVGNIIFNGEDTCGVKIMSATPTLDHQGEFWYDFTNDLIRMYSVGNPASFYTDIECAKKWDAISGNADWAIFQNLDFRYWGQHGTSDCGNYNKWYDCDFSYIGGGDQLNNYTIRLGNGLQQWDGVHDVTVERCRFDNIYDAAISPQGDIGTYQVFNLYYRNNIISNCEYSYEIFWHDVSAYTHHIYFENNTCLWAGRGWAHNQRPDGVMAEHVRLGTIDATTDNIFIRNNIFYGATERIIYYHTAAQLAKVSFDYNSYYVYPGGAYAYRTDETPTYYYSLGTWQTISGQEANAVYGNPSLADTANYNFHLTSTSNVIGEGLYIENEYDFDNVAWLNPPSMGAYEYMEYLRVLLKSNGTLMTIRGQLGKYRRNEDTYVFPKSIIWFSDFHYGAAGWTQGELDAAVVGLNSQEAELYVASGDQIETTGDATQTAAFNALMSGLNDTLYTLRGNHDGGQFTQHFVINVEDVVVIAFYASYSALAPPPDYNNTGLVSEAELTWIETQLQAAAGKRIILMCHYPMTETLWGHIDNGYGREGIVALMDEYNVKLYLSGHVHGGNALTSIADTEDTEEINSYCAGTPNRFTVITIYEDRVVFTPYNLTSPYSATTPVNTIYFH